MKTILLVRHAETAMAGRFCGHTDPDLNCIGEMQLARIAARVVRHGIDRIIASDLRRALRTAQAIGQEIGIEPELRPRLREIHFGLWEGLSWNEIIEEYPNEAQTWVAEFPTRSAPDGELYIAFCERIDAELNSLLNTSDEGATAIVTHRGPMQYALTTFFGRTDKEAFEQTAGYGAVIVVASPPAMPEALP